MKKLSVVFDTRHRGFTFDCIVFFILADVVRELNKIEKLDVLLYTQSYRNVTEREITYSNLEKNWRIHNIISKIPFLLQSVDSVLISNSLPDLIPANVFPNSYHPYSPGKEALYVHQIRELNQLKGKNIEISRLRALPHSIILASERVPSKPFVTISIRKGKFQEKRNSNLEAWKKFTNDLEALGYQVFFIPDFEDLNQCLQDPFLIQRSLVDATSDLYLRLAYYSLAKHNFCVSNGTSGLLYFSPYPFSMFGIIRDGVNNCTAEFLKNTQDLTPGEKYYWLHDDQHFVWCDDSYSDLRTHLDKLIKLRQI